MIDSGDNPGDLDSDLDASSAKRSEWLREIIRYTEKFLDNIEHTSVYRVDDKSLDLLRDFGFSEKGRPMQQLLEIIEKVVDGTGINPAGPGHLGYVPGGGVYPTALGDFLAAITNRYAGIFYANPGAVAMEDQCIRWMGQLTGYPDTLAGNLSSGGSIATLTALTTARDHHQINPETVRKQVIYLTRQAHHCILKAMRIAALDHAVTRFVSMDDQLRMDTAALRKQIDTDQAQGLRPFLIVGSAGTTDTGAIDPLEEMANIAHAYGCWFHIDAAYGGFFCLLDEMQTVLGGIGRSDSLVLDPHKGLFLSYGTGAVLIRDRTTVLKAFTHQANYMQDATGSYPVLNSADVSPELTKHFRGLRMWLSLQLFGLAPFRATIREKLNLTGYFYEEVQKLGYDVGPKPILSICLFRLNNGNPEEDNALNRRLTQAILESGQIFISSTTIEHIYWMRICVMVFRTHKKHIDVLLELLKALKSKNLDQRHRSN